jgi:hypothetical protein
MSDDRSLQLKLQLLDEIWEEISSLEGTELDDYLASIGLAPDSLVHDYAKAFDAATKRERFEEARRQVRQTKVTDLGKLLSLDLAKKKRILNTIKDYADKTSEMTVAARNRKIEDEGDLDTFLEACLRLGLIDSQGNLKG